MSASFLSPLGFIQHAHTVSAVAEELGRARDRGELTIELVDAALYRAFQLGQIDVRRGLARSRRHAEERAEAAR